MHELVSQFLLQAAMVWRRRWIVLAVAWLVCLGGWAIVPFMPDVYQSSARVYVDTESMLGPLLRGLAVENDPDRELDMMQRTLKSRPNMEKVARMTDLDLTAKGPVEMENLVGRLRDRIIIRSETRNLFSIGFQHTDPVLARRVVQAILTIYVESNLGTSRREMTDARRFLDDEILSYEQQLDAAEQRLANFKQTNMGLLPGETGYYQRFEQARGDLAAARSKMQIGIATQQELQRQLSKIPQFFESEESGGFAGPPSDLQARILDLEKTVDDLLIGYTPKHPDVTTALRRLEVLKKQFAEELQLSETGAQDDDQGMSDRTIVKTSNPVYEQIKLRLVNTESAIVALRGTIARHEAKVREMEQLAQRVPAVEAELTRLDRDYGIFTRNYEQLLARREAAKISESRETKSEEALFRIIESPQTPNVPSGPPRLLYLSAIIVIGLGIGVAFAAFLANLRPAFLHVERLKQAFGIPVFGRVSYVLSSAEKSWRATKLAGFSLAFVALLGTFGALYATEYSVGLSNVLSKDVASMVKARFKYVF